jgi:hypothetical protein
MERGTDLEDLEIRLQDDLGGQWRNRDIDHLQEEAQMGEKPAHCRVSFDQKLTGNEE